MTVRLWLICFLDILKNVFAAIVFDPVFGVYVCVIKQEEEEGVGAAQNDTAEEKHPGSGSDDSDDDSSVRPPQAPVAVFFVAEYRLLVKTNQNQLTCLF